MTQRSILAQVRRAGHRIGIDVARWPDESLASRATKLLISANVDLVVDVGANDGGYGQDLRDYGYSGRIVSLEPVQSARRRLLRKLDRDWVVLPYALGNRSGSATINVAGNSAASSSILPMLPLHEQYAPQATYVDTEVVKMRRLDDVWSEINGSGAHSPFLKLDVQGYEMEVLSGAAETLRDFVGVRLELSFEALYEGSVTWLEAIQFMQENGFAIARIDPGFSDPHTGKMLQCDGTFLRSSPR